MTGRAAFRGQPLLLLGGLLAAWMGMRAVLWQPPFEEPVPLPRFVESAPRPTAAPASAAAQSGVETPDPGGSAPPSPAPAGLAGRAPPAPLPQPIGPAPYTAQEPLPAPVRVPEIEAPARPLAPARFAVGHNLLLAAGLAQMEVPAVLLAYLQGAPGAAPGVPAAALAAAPPPRAERWAASRWSADGWLLLRRDTTTPFLSGRASYGRSQAGAVVRYRLAPASPLRPEAHLRASAALAGAREQELAAGLSARPLPAVPVRLIAEARASETGHGTSLRPAVYAVSEFPPLPLPLGARAEVYVQAGYVGGAFATPFADGQARIERPVARLGRGDTGAEFSAGAGAWGGAQKGSARLDIGPSAAVAFRLGEARGRLAADYRFRVAGDAEPSSGPALTLSAGF